MGLLDRLLGRTGMGRVYSADSVVPRYRDMAESAIAGNKYSVHATRGPRSVLVLRTQPALIALISREPSLTGGAPDMLIHGVYSTDKGVEKAAEEIAEVGLD